MCLVSRGLPTTGLAHGLRLQRSIISGEEERGGKAGQRCQAHGAVGSRESVAPVGTGTRVLRALTTRHRRSHRGTVPTLHTRARMPPAALGTQEREGALRSPTCGDSCAPTPSPHKRDPPAPDAGSGFSTDLDLDLQDAPAPGAMWLCPLLLWLPLALALSGQPEPEAPEDGGELHCGPQGLQFTVHPLGPGSGPSPALIAWDDHGLLHRLQNDSGCGTRVTAGPGSALVLEAAYGGCYVTEWGSQHIMPVGLEQADTAGHRAVATAQLLKCPVGLPAPGRSARHPLGRDALGAHLCDSVPVGTGCPAPGPRHSPGLQGAGLLLPPRRQVLLLWKHRGRREHNKTLGVPGSRPLQETPLSSLCCCSDLPLQPGRPLAVAVARNVTSPPLLLDSVRLALGTTASAALWWPHQPSPCSGSPSPPAGPPDGKPGPYVTGDQAVYENELVAAQDVRTWSRGSITRDSTFRLRVSCTYPVSSSALPVNVQVFLLPPPLPKTQPGALTLELQIAKDENYSSYYGAGDYPVAKLLRDPIYVEVALRHRTDPALGLLLRQCWATPGPDPGQQPQWALLVPLRGDNYQTQLIPVPENESLRFPSHAQRFSIFTFSFVDAGAGRALGGPVFLHCSVSVCQPAGSLSCVPVPVARRRRSAEAHDPNSTASISSQGPMILLQATEDPSPKLPKYSSAAGDSQALWVAGLSGTLIVGVLGVTYLAVKKWS
ncbi:hypothetical protein QTO34_012465 [Cnephaeus nilssonii]|uniref:ZP domain-containing protein n=1 Tax=Cnephaeus nilssonii TaxID=3371016 RepID=A0AA40HBJ2_CNENI|nr:hypothetical protein QTO34_012465 [Eptesicus nilssonii]